MIDFFTIYYQSLKNVEFFCCCVNLVFFLELIMNQSKQAKPKGYQDLTKLMLLFTAQGYLSSNLWNFLPRWPLLIKIVGLTSSIAVAYLLKKPGENIRQWIERSCGRKFNFSKVLKTLLCFTAITLLPVIYQLLTSSIEVYAFGMYGSSLLNHIFNISLFWVLIPLRMIQTFNEEWFFRRPLLGNNSYKDHIISILLFTFAHIHSFYYFMAPYTQGALYFFMASIALTLPVMLFNCLEYSWGLHLAHNLMVDFFYTPGTRLFHCYPSSSYRMGFFLKCAVSLVSRICMVFAAAFWQKDSLKLFGSKAREVKSEQINSHEQKIEQNKKAFEFPFVGNIFSSSPQIGG